GGPREQTSSANSPLAVHNFYGDRHRQFHSDGPRWFSGLGGIFAAAAALLDAGHRSLHVCAALSRSARERQRNDQGATALSGHWRPVTKGIAPNPQSDILLTAGSGPHDGGKPWSGGNS